MVCRTDNGVQVTECSRLEELSLFLLAEAADCLAKGNHRAALHLLAKGFLSDPKGNLFHPLADICRLMQRWEDLERFCQQRCASSPADHWPWYHLAGCSLYQRHFFDAIARLREALLRAPDLLEAWIELGNTWKRLGEIQRALVCYRQAIRIDPHCGRAQDNLLFALLFSDCYPPELLAQAHLDWGRQCQTVQSRAVIQPPVDQRIKIGYLSPDLREHSVTCFLEPLLQNHDRQQFEITCYQCNQDEDVVTERLRAKVDHWRSIATLSDEEACAVIRQDGIHILVELAGHTAGNRLSLMSCRPAPVQATWLGYPHSTGLASIGFRITDGIADPPGEADQWHTEQLVRLQAPFLCYAPPAEAPLVAHQPPCVRSGTITFACFNRIDKISASVLELWRLLLQFLPKARLILKSETFGDPLAAARFISRSKLPEDRLILLDRTPDRASHLALYNQVDIALDTYPYNGTTTTCEALWMGVPVITLAGRHHAARVGKTLLESVAMGHMVVETPEAYLKLACSLAGEPAYLMQLRQSLRSTVQNSPLCDGEDFAKKMEACYRAMLQDLSV